MQLSISRLRVDDQINKRVSEICSVPSAVLDTGARRWGWLGSPSKEWSGEHGLPGTRPGAGAGQALEA